MAKLSKRYISHDESASRDDKILRMREKYGARGYGLFWEIVEYLFTCNGRAELNPKIVSIAIGEDAKSVGNFLSDCIEGFKLFETDGVYFWSNRLLTQIDQIINISEMKSKAVKSRYEKNHDKIIGDNNKHIQDVADNSYTCTTGVPHMNNRTATINKTKEINEINCSYGNQKPHRFLRPSLEEVEAYCIERENDIDPIHFHDYYEANGWKIGKNPMKSWKAAIRTWEKNSSGKAEKQLPSQSYDPYENLRRLG
ncbi:MAG: DUF4373 domain-containing protein [Clostridia bacterium]|nr:DUF4373 domain-containing protein [Clostridia bacterium]